MRSLPSVFSLLLWLGFWLGSLTPAWATHVQGGQLTYLNVGTNQYVATLYLYRDCSGSTLPTSMSLLIKNGCNGATQGTYPMTPVPNSIATGTQYCPAQQQQANCATGTLPNYETQQYRTATITIQPGQWLLSTEICCRPSTANLVGQDNFYYEAALNNQIVLPNGQTVTIQNNSPQYSAQDVPVPFVPVRQNSTISFNTTDPDNTSLMPNVDSLVFSLTSPLSGCNIPVPYRPYPSASEPGGPCIVLPPPAMPTIYTPQLPIDVGFNVTGQCPLLIGTTMQFAYADGQFTFNPRAFNGGASADGRDKYVVVGRVDDYRKLPGSNRRYLVGTVRREIMVIVINSVNNTPNAPAGAYITPNSNASLVSSVDSTFLTVYTCNYSQVRLRFSDPDPNDALTVSYTGPGSINTDILQSGDIGSYTLINNGTTSPTAVFKFQPSASMAGRRLRIPFRIADDACPVRGYQNRIVIINVLKGSFLGVQANGSGPAIGQATVCQGSGISLGGLVGRPDSVLNVVSGAVARQQYAYAWTATGTAATSGLNAAQAAGPLVTVAPTQTTRYFLRVTPTLGFGTSGGGCGDTTSVLVRVAPQPAMPTITRQGNMLVSSATTGNQWYLNGQPIAGATGSSYTPTTSGSYTVAATVGTGSVVCASPASAAVLGVRGALAGSSVQVLPTPTPDGQVTVRLTGYRQATTLTVFDALGRVVRTAAITKPNAAGTSQALDLGALPAGVYVLRVSTPGGVDVRRIVRQ